MVGLSREARMRKRRNRIYLSLLVAVILLAVLIHKQVLQDVFSPTVKGAYYHVVTEEKAVALTFDVIWEPGETGRILDELDRYNVRATFFMTGIWVRKNPDLAREILIRGHEIGQHSYSHKHLGDLDDKKLAEEFDLMEEALQEELNQLTFLFRPPYGEIDQRIYDAATERGYVSVLWSIDPHDWLNPGVDKIVSRVVQKLHNGAIILLHTSSTQSADALPLIIQSLRMKEYEIRTVTELLELAQ
jgi:polysaccharide deacetylase family sporulation protein PdaB